MPPTASGLGKPPADRQEQETEQQGEKVGNKLRSFISHGLDVQQVSGSDQATCQCPFCDREAKLYISVETGQWQCFVCGEKGNVASFLQKLHSVSDANTSVDHLAELAADRGLLDPMTLNYWGVVKSHITGEWLVPGWNTQGKITQLYRYVQPRGADKRMLLATADLAHAIHGVNLYDPKKPDIYLCEGPWDAMILWEILRQVKQTEEGLQLTGTEAASLMARVNILAVPGCLVFRPEWASLFAGKRIFLLYDNDHPRTINKKLITGGGLLGMRKAAEIAATFSPPPKEIHYLCWGSEHNTHNPELPSGYDVRDVFFSESTERGRVGKVEELLGKIVLIPTDWIEGRTPASASSGRLRMQAGECKTWEEVVNACRRAMTWTEGLDRGLSVIYASIISVKSDGDPLWIKLIGPPSTGKSTLAEAVSVADNYVYALSTLTGFHSGWKTDREGEEDHGLIPKISDKTLIIKDADTILSAANKDKILSEARDLYDNVCRTHYLNGISREYHGIRTTVILCGTKSLHALDGSELGERFLDVVIMDTIDAAIEAEICRRKVYTAWNNSGKFANGKPESIVSPEMMEMKKLIGGYVNYLRENAETLVNKVTQNEPDSSVVDKLTDLGTFVAYIRARPSKRHDEGDDREFATRLCSQHTRLAICLAAVLGKDTVDKEVLRRVRQTAMDTARGRTFEICKHIYSTYQSKKGPGISVTDLALQCNSTDDRKRKMLRFLRKIGAVEAFRNVTESPTGEKVYSTHVKWRLTEVMKRLWESVVLDY